MLAHKPHRHVLCAPPPSLPVCLCMCALVQSCRRVSCQGLNVILCAVNQVWFQPKHCVVLQANCSFGQGDISRPPLLFHLEKHQTTPRKKSLLCVVPGVAYQSPHYWFCQEWLQTDPRQTSPGPPRSRRLRSGRQTSRFPTKTQVGMLAPAMQPQSPVQSTRMPGQGLGNNRQAIPSPLQSTHMPVLQTEFAQQQTGNPNPLSYQHACQYCKYGLRKNQTGVPLHQNAFPSSVNTHASTANTVT